MRKQPRKRRTYFHHHMDSTRWEVYTPRPDDIIITTSYKSGTTLTQQLLYNMLVRDTSADEFAPAVDAFSPWIDSRFYRVPKDELAAYIDALPHRRFLKSHLPFDGLPYYPQVKYLIVARDPRDVFMSLLNHYGAYSASQYARLDADAPQPMPRFDGDAKALWRNWISRGWFDWEEEGWPFWSNMYHTKTYWDFRELPNFLFLHYAELRRDLEGAIRRIGDFIEHELTRADVDRIARAVSFEKVKSQAVAESAARGDDGGFKGGQATFINQGSNGRWHDFLDESDLALYRQKRDRVLSDDCIAWLEQP